jgi:uncharacterized membrane protein
MRAFPLVLIIVGSIALLHHFELITLSTIHVIIPTMMILFGFKLLFRFRYKTHYQTNHKCYRSSFCPREDMEELSKHKTNS